MRRVALLALCVATSELAAQQRDTLAAFPERSLAPLIARLPGRSVTLTEMSEAARRHSLALRIADATRSTAAANALSEGRVFDPQLRFAQGMQRSPGLAGNAGGEQVSTSTAGVGVALPWGTALDAAASRSGRDAVDRGLAAPNALSLSFAQPLLDGWNQQGVALRAARIELSAAERRYLRAQELTIADVELRYWSLAEAQAIEAVYQRSFELSQTLLSRNVALAERGLIADVDVLTVRSGVAFRRATLVQARRVRREASDELVFAAYGDRAANELAADSLPLKATDLLGASALDIGADTLVTAQEAIARRLDVQAAALDRDAATARRERARNGMLPGLALTGGWTSAASPLTTGSAAGGNAAAWRLGVQLSTPLFNRGDRGVAAEGIAAVTIADARLELARNDVRSGVREARRAVGTGVEQFTTAEEAASLAWDQLLAERRRLELGLGDSFRLLQTEENAVQAQLAAVRSRYDVLRARVRLRLAAGRILDGR